MDISYYVTVCTRNVLSITPFTKNKQTKNSNSICGFLCVISPCKKGINICINL